MKDPASITSELARLKSRKLQLEQLLSLQSQVNALETRLLLSEHDLVTATRQIGEIVFDYYKLPLGLLTDRCRETNVSWARQVVFHLVRLLTGATFQAIGGITQRDHGTVLHGIRHVKNTTETEPNKMIEVGALEYKCREKLGIDS